MKTKFLSTLAISAIVATAAISSANAQARVDEVDQRVQNQENRVNSGVANGTVTANQAARDDKRIANVQNQTAKDEAKNGGHLTKREQKHLNKKLNKNSGDIHKQRQN